MHVHVATELPPARSQIQLDRHWYGISGPADKKEKDIKTVLCGLLADEMPMSAGHLLTGPAGLPRSVLTMAAQPLQGSRKCSR
jgi:hypothetical protein